MNIASIAIASNATDGTAFWRSRSIPKVLMM